MNKTQKVILSLGLVAVLCVSATASAQCCPKKVDVALEQMLVLQTISGFDLYSDEVAEFIDGYMQYRAEMDKLNAERDAAITGLTAALAAGKTGSAVVDLMEDLMDADEEIFSFKQDAIAQTEGLLSGADQAAICLLISTLDAQKAKLRTCIAGNPCAACPAAGAAGAGAAAAASPAEGVAAALDAYGKALLSQDVDAMMALVSAKFSNYEMPDKASMKEFIEGSIDMGYLDDGELFLDDAETEFDGDTATIYPIDFSGAAGEVTLELVFTKEATGWMLTGMDIEGL